MLSAISFGVFCRSAPSTRAIMRSRKVEPCCGGDADLDPVRDHLGAAGDRRAIAAAFADDRRRFAGDRRLVDRGDALDDVAVARDEIAGLDQHDIALPELGRGNALPLGVRPSASRLATVSVLVLRRVAACALPRPSATASAKLANSTVNQSQRLIWKEKPSSPAPVTRSRMNRIVVRLATTSTTNMTGLRIMRARVELPEGVDDRRAEDLRIGQGGDGRPLPLL